MELIVYRYLLISDTFREVLIDTRYLYLINITRKCCGMIRSSHNWCEALSICSFFGDACYSMLNVLQTATLTF